VTLNRRVTAVTSATRLIAEGLLPHRDGPSVAGLAPPDPQQAARLHIRWPEQYEWAPAFTWVEPLVRHLANLVRLERAPIPQDLEGVVTMEVVCDGRPFPVAIDYFDGARLLDATVARHALVFKMQYGVDGYGSAPVIPGGYVPSRLYFPRLLPGLRRQRARRSERFAVYGRFSVGFAPEIRKSAVGLLRAQSRFAYEGELKTLPYGSYLREAAQSMVCLDLPGNGDLCHRLVEYLAIGCCVVRPQLATELPAPLRDGIELCCVSPDLSDLVDVCADLVADPARRDALGHAARAYYDEHLAAPRLAVWYVQQMLERLPSAASTAC
jgi:glycosyl transferase family 1